MAPIETEQSVVTESEVSEPAPQPAQPEPTEPEPTEPEPTEPEPTNPEPVETVEDLEDGINSTHTDIILGDDEYKGDTGADALRAELDKLSPEEKAEIDAALERAMKEHPEWFTDDSSGTSPAPYQGPAVGTPSTGQFQNPNYTIGESGHVEGGENATVY